MIPAGPHPTTATFIPFFSILTSVSLAFAICQSATKRSIRPIPTGSPLIPRTHFPSHWFSCGHTRPQIAGNAFSVVITSYAPSKSPAATFSINAGIGTLTGHPPTQGLFLQFKQRAASSIAISFVYPRATSSKFLLRTFGSCSGIGTFLRLIFAIVYIPLPILHSCSSSLNIP